MHLIISIMLQEITKQCYLDGLTDNQGWEYIRVDKGIHSLKQTGITANKELGKHMDPRGYKPATYILGLSKHNIYMLPSSVW